MKKDFLRGGNMQTFGIVNPLKSKKKKLFAFKTGQTDMAIPKYMCPSPQNFVKKKISYRNMHKINSNKQELYKTNRAEYVQCICSYHMISKELNSVNATFNREKV